MSDQEQESHQDSDQRAPKEEEIITTEGFLDRRLSLLRLDHSSMASTDAVSDRAAGADDTESYQVEFTDPNPPRSAYGNNTPLKRRSSSSTFSPPPQPADADAGYHRLISGGYNFLHLPSSGNECAATAQPNSPSLRRSFSLDYAGSRPIQPAEISNRGALAVPENQTRRSLFPPPVNGSAAQSLPPPHPLARTISDPTWLSCLQEKNPVPRTDPNSPCELPGLGSGLGSTQDTSPFKRLKRMDSARKIRQQMNEINELIDQMVDEDAPITSATDYKVLGDDVGSHNNGGSSAEETMNKSAAEEVRSPEELPEKEITEEDLEEEEADIVKAKRVGECTFLEFKCRCGSGYSVGIIGNSCFYKLI